MDGGGFHDLPPHFNLRTSCPLRGSHERSVYRAIPAYTPSVSNNQPTNRSVQFEPCIPRHNEMKNHKTSPTTLQLHSPTPSLLCNLPGRDCKGRSHKPTAIIHRRLCPQQLLVSRLIRPMSPHQITILLSLQQRNQVNARPHFLPRKLTNSKGL